MYEIKIDRLQIFANHGVKEEEKILGQKFEISVVLTIDNKIAWMNDDIKNTINYSKICNDIVELTEGNVYDLIETIADKIALHLLKNYSKIFKVSVQISKPWAPIKKSLKEVSVKIERKKRRICLSLGSNIEPKEEYLNFAVREISKDIRNSNIIISQFYDTLPEGKTNQERFLNAAVMCDTCMEPYELLEFIHAIENAAGRVRVERWGPRTLDIDIILFGEMCINEEHLVIPHSRMTDREFVLKPLYEIAPYVLNPLNKKTIAEMYNDLLFRHGKNEDVNV